MWQIYFPFLQDTRPDAAVFYVRTSREPESMMAPLRRTLQQLDANVPPQRMRSMDDQVKRSLVNQRLLTGLSTAFSLLATLLAIVGLYGVMAYSVTRRTREIGLRMAIGAASSRVLWLILREALLIITIGVTLALPAAWGLGRYIESELYGITALDPTTIAVAIIALTTAAACAALIPAIRAARIDPIRALRHE
jgi:ABC-type antimicrobial peptide transport system permease subunit